MRGNALLFAATALAAAASDLTDKARSDVMYVHERSAVYALAVTALVTVWTAAIVATRSRSVAAAGGIVAGGAVANLASLTVWSGVPDPIAVEDLAFNLADVFVLGGFALTTVATLVYAARNRDRLREPIRARGR